jgi:ABC-2 type transport system permease protein
MSSNITSRTPPADHRVLPDRRRLRPAFWRAAAAEWGKAVSVRAPWLCLAAALAAAVVSAAGLANDFVLNVRHGQQPPFAVVDTLAILGQSLQLAVVVAGAGLMLLVTAEYSTGTATTTFTAQPHRTTVLLAKVAVAAVLAAAAGAFTTIVARCVQGAILGSHAAPGGPGVAASAARAGVLWATLAVFIVALATLLRSAVGTLAALVVIFLGLLAVPDPVGHFLPGQAALAFFTASASSYPSTVGLVLVAGWAGAMLLLAAAAQRRRDL